MTEPSTDARRLQPSPFSFTPDGGRAESLSSLSCGGVGLTTGGNRDAIDCPRLDVDPSPSPIMYRRCCVPDRHRLRQAFKINTRYIILTSVAATFNGSMETMPVREFARHLGGQFICRPRAACS